MDYYTMLSIIIPMYNSEATIKKCLDSIPIEESIEVILIDDGSSDRTKEICLEYCEKHKQKSTYTFQKNSGPGAARNRGIDLAKGRYIMFVDSDDYLDTVGLVEILESQLVSGVDIVYYSFEQVDQKGGKIRNYQLDGFNSMEKSDLITCTLSWKLPWGQFKIIKRSLLDNPLLRFSVKSNDSEELIFTIRCLQEAQTFSFSQLTVYKYVKRSDSLSNSHSACELYETRKQVISSLIQKFGNQYKTGINNYIFVSYVQIIKLIAEQNHLFSGWKLYRESFRRDLLMLATKVKKEFLQKRYGILLNVIKYRFDFILFLAFRMMR